MTTTHITVTERPFGWDDSLGRVYRTAAEAQRKIMAEQAPGVLVLTWEPTTRVGKCVVDAITK